MRLTHVQLWERRWPHRKRGPYTVGLRVGILDGRPQIVEIRVRGVDVLPPDKTPFDAGAVQPITSTAIRLPLRQLLDECLAEARQRIRKGDDNLFGSPWKAPAMQEARRAMMAGKRAGRRPTYGPAHYQHVADIYSKAVDRRPTMAVAEAFVVDKSTAAKWVSRARALGFLPKTTKGRAAAATKGG